VLPRGGLPGPCLSFCLIHPRPGPFTEVHPDRICAVGERWRTPVNAGQHCWKACWVQALGGSNPPSSATLARHHVPVSGTRSWQLLMSDGGRSGGRALLQRLQRQPDGGVELGIAARGPVVRRDFHLDVRIHAVVIHRPADVGKPEGGRRWTSPHAPSSAAPYPATDAFQITVNLSASYRSSVLVKRPQSSRLLSPPRSPGRDSTCGTGTCLVVTDQPY
jgi:hypothetical protein